MWVQECRSYPETSHDSDKVGWLQSDPLALKGLPATERLLVSWRIKQHMLCSQAGPLSLQSTCTAQLSRFRRERSGL